MNTRSDICQALQDSTDATDAAPFIAFMLAMISGAVSSVPPQVQHTVGLKDRKFL
jgi:hypothetical protein